MVLSTKLPERDFEMSSASETSLISDYWAPPEPLEENGGFYVSRLLRPYIIETTFGQDQVDARRNNVL